MYPWLFRTFLSRMDPETAHHAAMLVIRLLGFPPFSWVARALTKPDPSLRVQPLGLQAGEPEWVALERGVQFAHTREGRALDEIVMRGFWRHYRSLMTDEAAAR